MQNYVEKLRVMKILIHVYYVAMEHLDKDSEAYAIASESQKMAQEQIDKITTQFANELAKEL